MDYQIILSKQNEKIKYLKKLSLKKYREKFRQFKVENLTIIHDAFYSGFEFDALYITEDNLSNRLVRQILKEVNKDKVYVVSPEVNDVFSDLDSSSGICATYQKTTSILNPDKIVVYLNSINDPGNLGTILRSALAFNLTNIVIDDKSADLYNYKTINAARDSLFKLNIALDEDYKYLKGVQGEMCIYATSLGEHSEDLDILKINDPYCLVLGNETRGVEDTILKLADEKIKINISENIESLNVSVAAGIIFYSIFNSKS